MQIQSISLKDQTFQQLQARRLMASGRNWAHADCAQLVDFGDCARAEFHWADGAYEYVLHDTKQEAIEHLESLGFFTS